MGCPSSPNESIKKVRGISMFGVLENDHIYPSARMLSRFAETAGMRLCKYHNALWKNGHIAFALSTETLNTQIKE
jgi:hypothetical protein